MLRQGVETAVISLFFSVLCIALIEAVVEMQNESFVEGSEKR